MAVWELVDRGEDERHALLRDGEIVATVELRAFDPPYRWFWHEETILRSIETHQEMVAVTGGRDLVSFEDHVDKMSLDEMRLVVHGMLARLNGEEG